MADPDSIGDLGRATPQVAVQQDFGVFDSPIARRFIGYQRFQTIPFTFAQIHHVFSGRHWSLPFILFSPLLFYPFSFSPPPRQSTSGMKNTGLVDRDSE